MGTELTTIQAKRAQAAQAATATTRAPAFADMLKLKAGGIFHLGDEKLGDQLAVVIASSIWENSWHDAKYDAEAKGQAPRCYAFGRSHEEMIPHISMAEHPEYFVPQGETCATCPHGQWGSAPTGKGKACKNRERLALIPAGIYKPRPKSRDFDLDLFDGSTEEGRDHFRTADALVLKLPVTSVKNWSEYVHKLATTVQRPPWDVVTRVYTEPHPTYQYVVKFEMIEELQDELFEIMAARAEATAPTMVQPYSPPRQEEAAR